MRDGQIKAKKIKFIFLRQQGKNPDANVAETAEMNHNTYNKSVIMDNRGRYMEYYRAIVTIMQSV